MRVFHSKQQTSGKGLWSSRAAEVRSTHADIPDCYSSVDSFAELRVYFHSQDWNVDQDGLIYTDPMWIEDLRRDLIQLGYSPAAVNAVDYSEQGMQGDNYVSLDCEQPFVREWFLQEVDDEDE